MQIILGFVEKCVSVLFSPRGDSIAMQIAALLFTSERFLFSALFKTETAKPS